MTTGVEPLQGLQGVVDPPAWARETLGLGPKWGLRGWEVGRVRRIGAASDRIVVRSAPPAQACVRLGLPANDLYARSAR